MQAQERCGVGRCEQQRQARDGCEPHAEGQAAERSDGGDIDGGDAGGRVQAKADGSAREGRKPEYPIR